MPRFDLARFGGEPKRLRCNAEHPRRLVQIKPWLAPIRRRPKNRDLMMRPERGDPLPCPAIAVAGHQAVPVEDAGDQVIIGDENQLADGGEHVGGDAVALSAAAPRQAQFGMNAADPMVRRTISDASSSISATTSWMTVRTIRFLSLASVGGADQTALRSAASAATWTGDSDGSDVEASCAAIPVSISPTRVSALFHRNSSSAAISRFCGSMASYCRNARSAL